MHRLAILFVVLIVYGSLYPFSGWQALHGAPLFGFLGALPDYIEKADVVQNVLAYIPFGLFTVAALRRRVAGGTALGLALLAGGLLSLTMESLQQWLPSRDASLADLALNLLGTQAGAMLALVLNGHSWAGARLLDLRRQWLRGGTLANLGLGALALWALSQTSPLVPSFDVGQLRSALAPLYWAVLQPGRIELLQLLVYACYLAALGLMLRLLVRPERSALWLFSLVVALVFGLKVLMQSRQLGPEAVLGAGAAWLALALCARMARPASVARAGSALLVLGFAFSELAPGAFGRFVDFNWLPLVGQMASISGLQNILEVSWPFFAIAIFARLLAEPAQWRHVALAGGGLVIAVVFALEWWQQALPGRHGDITQVMLAWAGWMLPWTFQGSENSEQEATTPS
ncbi:MAG: VanZ family protein [Pseudomonadota bacterium]